MRPTRRDDQIRTAVFTVICATLIGLAGHHYATEAWWQFTVDVSLLAFALASWRPWMR